MLAAMLEKIISGFRAGRGPLTEDGDRK